MQTMKQGLGFGIGSSIAHNIFDSDKTVIHKHEPIQSVQPIQPAHPIQASTEYIQCMKESSNNTDACKHLLD